MKNNIKFIAYVNFLAALVDVNLLQRDPTNRNNVLIFMKKVPVENGRKRTGWFTQNIFDVAQGLYSREKEYESLLKVIRKKGYEPEYNQEGDFVSLKKIV